MEAFGIFEGGGAKGLAHIGALKAAEERHIEFVGVAGASAGSIVAALIAAGYTADELFDPQSTAGEKGKFDKRFLDFFDAESWQSFQKLARDVEDTFGGSGAVRAWLKAPFFYRRNRKIFGQLLGSHGVFDTAAFRQWLNELLAAKVRPSGEGPEVLFEDLAMILRIIATDVTGRQIKVFGTQKTPRIAVADAVAASISIPLFFVPKQLERTEYVDGGLLSNFPAWIFDDRREQAGPLVPTFGFKLIEGKAGPPDLTSFPAFAKQLFSTALSGDAILETRDIENLHVVPLPVRASTFDFDMTDETKNDLYLQGKDAARDFFLGKVGPRDPDEMRQVLETVHDAMAPLLRPDADRKRDFHLRVNVIMPTTPRSRGRLRVYYSYNMDDDADDRLEFRNDEGVCGICWRTHRAQAADLEAARKDRQYEKDYRMEKYQQALLRPSLKSLLSVPIFHPDKYDANKPDEKNEVIGILSFDSDEDLYSRFQDGEIQKVAAEKARLVARQLLPG